MDIYHVNIVMNSHCDGIRDSPSTCKSDVCLINIMDKIHGFSILFFEKQNFKHLLLLMCEC